MDCFAWSLFSEVSTMLLKKTDRYSIDSFPDFASDFEIITSREFSRKSPLKSTKLFVLNFLSTKAYYHKDKGEEMMRQ